MLDLALVIPRVLVGLIMAGHGTQKLFGWFGGGGLERTAQFFGQLGLRPNRFLAVVAGLLETLGGLGLALGLFTPVAAVAVAAVMLAAIVFAHWPRGLWNATGGFEYNLVLLALTALFGLNGAGQYALDAAWGIVWPVAPSQIYLGGLIVAVVLVAVLRLAAARPAEQPASAKAAA